MDTGRCQTSRWKREWRRPDPRARTRESLPKQPVQFGLGLIHLRRVGRSVGARPRLEVIAEVGLRLVAHFLGRRLAAMLRNPRIIINAHAADVQLGATLRSLIEPPPRHTAILSRSTALPG